MNTFVIGWALVAPVDLDGATAAVTSVVDELAFLERASIRTWRSPSGNVAVVTAGHSQEQAVASYVQFESSRMALFAGRPIRWTPEGDADGRGPLDPCFYLAPSEQWAETLSGRCTAARYDEDTGHLDVYTDPLGAYPVYSAEAGGTRWFSNRPSILAAILGRRGQNTHALATFLGCGWSLGGATVWDGVERLPRASLHRFGGRDGAATHKATPLLPIESIASYFGVGWDPGEAARVLVATVRALADWPGRKLSVGLTGGRDSRLVFAACVAAGLDFDAETIAFPSMRGFPDTNDVVVARRVAEVCGRALSIEMPVPGSGVRGSARVLRLISSGLVSLGDTGLLTPPESGVPLRLTQSGQGGEIARAEFGIGENSTAKLVDGLFRHIVPAWPRPIVTSDAMQTVRDYVVSWVGEHLERGVAPSNIPDVFYLLERMSNWAGPAHSVYDSVNDVTSPLWTTRLLPYQFGLPAPEREREFFHLRLLEALVPELARLPFAGVNPRWPTFPTRRSSNTQRYRMLAFKITREFRRRASAAYRRRRDPSAGDPLLAEAMDEARECALAMPSHPAWDVLDRSRVHRLLSQAPSTLDPRRQRYVWRLVTIFAAENDARPTHELHR